MKYLFLLLLIFNLAQAQEMQTEVNQNNLTGFFKVLNSIEFQNHINQMKEDGQTASSYSALIGVNGQIYTIAGADADYRTIPFDIKIGTDGRIFLDIAAVDAFIEGDRIIKDLGVKVLSFEYKKDFDFVSQKEFFINLIEGRINAEKAVSDKIILTGQGKAGLGYGSKYQDAGFSVTSSPSGLHEIFPSSLLLSSRIGMKYRINTKDTINVGLSAQFMRKKYHYYILDKYQEAYDLENSTYNQRYNDAVQAQGDWEQEKLDWEIANGYAYPVENDRYVLLSGAEAKPGLPSKPSLAGKSQDIVRRSFVLTPKIGFTKGLKNGNSLNFQLATNLFISDILKGIPDYAFDNAYDDSWTIESNNEYIKRDLLNLNPNRTRFNFKITFTFGK